MATVSESVEIAASPSSVWDRVVAWESQGDWMLLTRVETAAQGGQGQGGGIVGVTGLGPLVVRDPMTITTWEPPSRLVMRHTGRLVRGSGAFETVDLGNGRCRFTWSEWLDLPLGPLGRLGWFVGAWAFRRAVLVSLRRFAAQVERTT